MALLPNFVHLLQLLGVGSRVAVPPKQHRVQADLVLQDSVVGVLSQQLLPAHGAAVVALDELVVLLQHLLAYADGLLELPQSEVAQGQVGQGREGVGVLLLDVGAVVLDGPQVVALAVGQVAPLLLGFLYHAVVV